MVASTKQPRGRTVSNPLFPLGKIVATPGAISALEEAGQNPGMFLERHQAGDWGDCDEADSKENDLSVREGFHIFSVFHARPLARRSGSSPKRTGRARASCCLMNIDWPVISRGCIVRGESLADRKSASAP